MRVVKGKGQAYIEELERLLRKEKQKNTRLLEELASVNSKLFRLENIKNDSQVCYYTGFSSFFALKSFYDYLGPAVDHLSYSHDGPIADEQVKRCRSRALPPLEEFFMTMLRLRAGLFEQDMSPS